MVPSLQCLAWEGEGGGAVSDAICHSVQLGPKTVCTRLGLHALFFTGSYNVLSQLIGVELRVGFFGFVRVVGWQLPTDQGVRLLGSLAPHHTDP